MKSDLLKRLRLLEAKVGQARAEKTVFILEDGSQFLTDDDPVTYLLRNGPKTPRGRIVRYEGGEAADPLSSSVYGYIRDLISAKLQKIRP